MYLNDVFVADFELWVVNNDIGEQHIKFKGSSNSILFNKNTYRHIDNITRKIIWKHCEEFKCIIWRVIIEKLRDNEPSITRTIYLAQRTPPSWDYHLLSVSLFSAALLITFVSVPDSWYPATISIVQISLDGWRGRRGWCRCSLVQWHSWSWLKYGVLQRNWV